ncbi:MAG: hypothetical protein DMH00_09290 [Acidobacteria bacterium]|nr:MAG: hypothetical protein DMH00_09290 [Acidobacteriota bacterium]
MITGYNTDVEYNARIYHVQTEDKGTSNPVIESLIYLGGEILAARRTSYEDLLPAGLDPKALAGRLESQHQRMVLNVRQGRCDPEGMKSFGSGIVSDRGFEEVVLDYLANEFGPESLQITLESPPRFEEGMHHEFEIRARGELSALPVKNVKVSLRLITPVDKPQTLVEGKTDAEGLFREVLTLPTLEEGGAALVLQASLDEDRVELKWLVGPGSVEG